mmetsp:Transcript_52296/g.124764  ORF Transcript_52296/g.124764 Transcript_52296/m.124764 type:complete len:231 (+) Transcript_52296:2224-2916(+)
MAISICSSMEAARSMTCGTSVASKRRCMVRHPCHLPSPAAEHPSAPAVSSEATSTRGTCPLLTIDHKPLRTSSVQCKPDKHQHNFSLWLCGAPRDSAPQETTPSEWISLRASPMRVLSTNVPVQLQFMPATAQGLESCSQKLIFLFVGVVVATASKLTGETASWPRRTLAVRDSSSTNRASWLWMQHAPASMATVATTANLRRCLPFAAATPSRPLGTRLLWTCSAGTLW